ncbi:MAG TPA: hypothetical protein VF032_00015 [Thermoleophilaceae bacterium]
MARKPRTKRKPPATAGGRVPGFGVKRIPRSQPAYALPDATRFARDPHLKEAVRFLRLLKQFPHWVGELDERTRPTYCGRGRRPRPGSWALLYIAFMLADTPDIQPWYTSIEANSALWAEAGFDGPVPYSTVHHHFCRLEQQRYVSAFEELAAKVIRNAMAKDKRVARHLHVDGTGYQTHAALVHCCPDKQRCRELRGHHPRVLRKAFDETINAQRHDDAAKPEDAIPDVPTNGLRRVPDEIPSRHGWDVENYSYWIQDGHLYRSRDKTAGARFYGHRKRSKRFWFGGTSMPAIDDYTELPVATHQFRADRNEHTEYPELHRKIVNTIETEPVSITVDRGLAFRAIFEHNTRRGVMTFAPERAPAAGKSYVDLRCDEFDEHGMPRCKHCGGETDVKGSGLGFYITGAGDPRIRFRCRHRHLGAACASKQSISCSKEWRLLLPISKFDEVGHELLHIHKNKEAVHDHNRDRHQVAGNSLHSRPKRAGLPVQQLRAAASMAIDWLRISFQRGWLAVGHVRRVMTEPRPRKVVGETAVDRLIRTRRMRGLMLPYGAAAERVKLAREGPWAPVTDPDPAPF